MNEEEYFDEIRRLKKRKVSDSQARRIIKSEKRKGLSVLDDYGTAADVIEGAVRQPLQALAGVAKAIPAGLAAIWEHGWGGDYPWQEAQTAMDKAASSMMYDPENRAQQAGAELSSFVPEMAEKVLRWIAEKSGEITGSDKIGAAVYTAPNAMAFPGLFTAILGRSLANAHRFGAFAGSHSGIDVRAHRGTLTTEVLGALTRNPNFSFYGRGALDRGTALTQHAIQAAGSMLSLSNPYYAEIMSQTGMTPATIRSLTYHYNGALKAKNDKSKRYHESVIASELRKVVGLKSKEGKPIPKNLWDAVEAFHPRLIEIKGEPNPAMMSKLLGADVDPNIMAALVSEFNRRSKFSDLDNNIFTAGANPGKVLSATPRHTDVLAAPGSAISPLSSTMKAINADKRFNFDSGASLSDWVKPGDRKLKVDGDWVDLYDVLDPSSLDAGYVNRVLSVKNGRQYRAHGYALYKDGKKVPLPMKKKYGGKTGIDWEAYVSMKGQWKRDKSLKGYQANYEPKGPKVRDIVVNDEPYFIFSTSKRGTDPLLGTIPGIEMVNKVNGKIHVLAADELDLFHGKARDLLETGFRKRFWTVFYGQHSMPGTKHPSTTKPTKTVDYAPPMYEYTDRILRTKPKLGGYLTKRIAPIAALNIGREERENRKTRNVY